ncbi:hypothetical protein HDU98_007554 [Podochytrium sp. JEL0797]|nr:hypothetical protein HDU98_007554 [Podochytrium sp. JEL0797]
MSDGICLNAESQYSSSTFRMSTANNGCLQTRMDAMIPYFNACSLSVVPDSFFGFKSGNASFHIPLIVARSIEPHARRPTEEPSRYNQREYDQYSGPSRSVYNTPATSTNGFPSEKRAGGFNQNRAYMAQQQQSGPSEKSGRSFDVYAQLEQRNRGGASSGSVGAGSTSGGAPVQIVYIQPETDAGVTLPVVAPPAYNF